MAKENNIKMKREPTIWENIFANDTSDKGLISKIYKDLTRVDSRKTNNPIKKMGKRPEQTLLQGGHRDGSEIYEKMLVPFLRTSLHISFETFSLDCDPLEKWGYFSHICICFTA